MAAVAPDGLHRHPSLERLLDGLVDRSHSSPGNLAENLKVAQPVVDEVREKFGVGPDKVVDVQALCGDSVDNVPGVPGIGVKTAAELINAYGDLDTLLAHADEIKQPKRRQSLIENEAKARLSKELVKLDDAAPLPCPLGDLRVTPLDLDRLLPFLREMEFRALATRMSQRLSGPAALAAAAATAGPSEPVIRRSCRSRRRAAMRSSTRRKASSIGSRRRSRPERSRSGRCRAPSPGRGPHCAAWRWRLHRAWPPMCRSGIARPGCSMPPGAPASCRSKQAIARLKPLFEDPGVLKIGHDMKGAAHLLRRYGVTLAPYDCTMLMSYVLDGGQFEHAIEELTRRAFAYELAPLKGLIGTGKSLVSFAEVATVAARDFVAERADAALRLHIAAEGAAGARAYDRILRDDRAPAGAGRGGDGG